MRDENHSAALPKILSVLRESRWLLLLACGVYLTLILFGFNRGD